MLAILQVAGPKIRHSAGRLRRAERGNASIEYALLGAIIGLGLISGLKTLKQSLNSDFDKISYAIGQAVQAPAAAPKVVASTSTDGLTVNGTYITRAWTTYTDGTTSMIQTNSNNAATGWGVAYFQYDAAGNTTGLSVNNPDGSFQYTETFQQVRAGVSVDTITDATGKPYAFQETTVWNNNIATQTRVMTLTSGRTDLWVSQTVISDYTNPQNVTVRATCTYANGQTVAC